MIIYYLTVNWNYISYYENLSEEFIREFSNEVNWDGISHYQNLSEEFIREFKKEAKAFRRLYPKIF